MAAWLPLITTRLVRFVEQRRRHPSSMPPAKWTVVAPNSRTKSDHGHDQKFAPCSSSIDLECSPIDWSRSCRAEHFGAHVAILRNAAVNSAGRSRDRYPR